MCDKLSETPTFINLSRGELAYYSYSKISSLEENQFVFWGGKIYGIMSNF